ncbi:MAG: TrmB family transcriptional regulator [Ginsengibacter sp.]
MDLTSLGLTKNEVKAYESLLQHGKLGAAQISKASGVPYGRIYDTLASLTEKGLARVIPEKAKKYAPADPQKIQEYLSKKRAEFELAEKRVMEYKTLYEKGAKEVLEIAEGKNNFYRVLRDMTKATKSEYDIKYDFNLSPEIIREASLLVKNSGDFKTLGRIDKETQESVTEWGKISKNIRKIQNDGVAVSIVDDKEILITLIKSNLIMLIRDKPFVKLMKQMFLASYKDAEPIK